MYMYISSNFKCQFLIETEIWLRFVEPRPGV